MKVVMTLVARDEADIVDAQLCFHLHAGVDFVVAMDNRSQDGTTEILRRYERSGHLHLIREEGVDLRQAEWVTGMARLAATEFGADWVINSDADEFWWPRGGSLKDVLATVPDRYGVVRGCWRHFLPRPGDDGYFAERMTVRLRTPAFPGDKSTVFHAHQKVAHRGNADVAIEFGNHNATGESLDPLRAWHPIEVLHFSFRSFPQLERKCHDGRRRLPAHEQTADRLAMWEADRQGHLREYYDSFVVQDDALERGLADGTLAEDTRLRDALRTLRAGDGTFGPPDPAGASPLPFPRPDVADEAMYAGEASTLVEIDGVVRAEQRVEALEARLRALERGPFARVRAKLVERPSPRRAPHRLAPP